MSEVDRPTKRFLELSKKKRKTPEEWVEIAEELAEANGNNQLYLYEKEG